MCLPIAVSGILFEDGSWLCGCTWKSPVLSIEIVCPPDWLPACAPSGSFPAALDENDLTFKSGAALAVVFTCHRAA